MRMYKEINRVIKNYVLLKYNSESYASANVEQFKLYLQDLLVILMKNGLILNYSFGPDIKIEGSEMIKFYLIYSIPDINTEFVLDFVANIN